MFLSVLLACQPTLVGSVPDTGVDDTDTDGGSADPKGFPLAGGLRISRVSAYQGVERVLAEDGGPPARPQGAVVAGRDALLRVFVDPDPDFEARDVTALLTVTQGRDEKVLERTKRIAGPSVDGDLESSLNFTLDAAWIGADTELSLEVREAERGAPGGGKAAKVTWSDALDVVKTGDLSIVVVPVRYQYDGSGRLPDTSPAQLQRIADLTTGMYPARSVSVRVERPIDWNQRIAPFNSTDWSRILQEMNRRRAQADEDPNTYYYGMFAPAATEAQFCRVGCILGLSLLGQNPNDPYFRASVGIGYPGNDTAETLVHEIGHAHGREHAPCGLGGQVPDRAYPYGGASIGTWGWDIVDRRLKDPDRTVDMMSYCAPTWVSDYTFDALAQRIRQVESSQRGATVTRAMFAIDDADGHLEPLGEARLSAFTAGEPAQVRLTAPDGRSRLVRATLLPFGDREGGIVTLDAALPEGYRAEIAD